MNYWVNNLYDKPPSIVSKGWNWVGLINNTPCLNYPAATDFNRYIENTLEFDYRSD